MSDGKRALDERCINTIRLLSAEAVEKAASGHPGMPLGCAPIAYVLWTEFMHHNPANPAWPNRDRFILSAGHGSALIYSMLHLTGYDLSLDEVKNFRQWGSKTPGHPEYGHTPGVETTTGPLGQGFANGVGMAIAQKFLAGRYNREGFPILDHFIYAIVSDGDLMEGVSCEAASLAGHLKLGKLIYFYDDNEITIEGPTSLAFSEDVARRFESYDWHVQRVEDGNDLDALRAATEHAQAETDRPSLIVTKTHLGYGSPKQDTASVHGEALGAEALAATKEFFGWPKEPAFYIPDEASACMRKTLEQGASEEARWKSDFERYRKEFPELADEFEKAMAGRLPNGWEDAIPVFKPQDGPVATRAASGTVMNALAPVLPGLIGGSADLAPSTKTLLKGFDERNLHFGIREHAMGAIVNGMAVYGAVIPYGATFLVFSDYMRGSVRLAALMNAHSIFVFTHDSIGVGEDGPTHQPVEHIAALRCIPNLTVFRPADANETAECWRAAVKHARPAALALTRQKLPILDTSKYAIGEGVPKGAYVLSDPDGAPEAILMATGSEVAVALEAQEKLASEGIKARVVSMPSWELFEEQSKEYRDSVLPPELTARVAIEAGCSLGWHKWIGDGGVAITIDHFGASAPGGKLMAEFGFTADNAAAKVKALLGRGG